MSRLLHAGSLGTDASASLVQVAESSAGAATVMPLWLLLILISASGFAVAGLVNSLGQLRQNVAGMTTLLLDTPTNIFWSLLFCMFAGPYWTGAKAICFWRQGELPATVCGMFVVMAIMWSFCSGVVVLQLMYFLQII